MSSNASCTKIWLSRSSNISSIIHPSPSSPTALAIHSHLCTGWHLRPRGLEDGHPPSAGDMEAPGMTFCWRKSRFLVPPKFKTGQYLPVTDWYNLQPVADGHPVVTLGPKSSLSTSAGQVLGASGSQPYQMH